MIFKKEYENKIRDLELKINDNENVINKLIAENMELIKQIDILRNKFITLPDDEKLLRIMLHRTYSKYDYETRTYTIVLELKYNKRIVLEYKDKKEMKEAYENIIKQI